jgi:hypothetical protein
MIERKQPRHLAAILGYTALVVGLPIVVLGQLPANGYKAWGGGGIDCDGPGLVLFFGLLGLAGSSGNRCRCWSPASACWSAWH